MAQFSYILGDYLMSLIFVLPLFYFIFMKFKPFVVSKTIPPLPPGPTPRPLLGNILHMVGKMPHVALSDLSKIHGPLMMLKLGTQKMVVASSPLAAKEILKTHDRILSARYVPKSACSNEEELNNSSIAMTDTCLEGWKYLRTLCRAELFSKKTLDAQASMSENTILELIDHVKANEGKVLNIKELVYVTLFNMISEVLLSSDHVGFNEKNEYGGVIDLFMQVLENFTAPNISDLYPILSKFDIQGIRKTSTKLIKKIEAIYEPIIQDRRKTGSCTGRNDFLDVLLLNKFNNARIHQLLIELLIGGAENSTTTVEWVMSELTKNPGSMTKVIQELDTEIGNDQVKECHLVKLSYLNVCYKETLRLHPAGPLLLPRRARETCQVMNYTIPKDAQIYINIWAIGRDPSIWEDPLMFKPERFLNVEVDFKGNDFVYTPFGGGRRICPGLPMAGRHVPLILAKLLHSFDWSLPNGISPHELDMTEKFGVSLQKEQPLLLIPKQRK